MLQDIFKCRIIPIAISFLICLTFWKTGNGQTNKSISVAAGIDYSYRVLQSDQTNAAIAMLIIRRNKEESGKSNWHLGVYYNQELMNRFFFKTGLQLSSIGYKDAKRTGLKWPAEVINGMWVPDPSLPHEIQIIRDNWYVEIPIAGRWMMNTHKFSPFLEAGLSPALYVLTKTLTKTDLGNSSEFSTVKINNFNRIQLISHLSFGLNVNATATHQWFVQTNFRYHLITTNDAPIKENLFSVGLKIGIRKLF